MTVIIPILSLNGGALGTVKGTDVYPAVDVTDFTQSPQGTTKPYQINQLAGYILSAIGQFVYAPVQAASTVNLNATYNNGISGVGATLTNNGSFGAFSLDGITGVLGDRYLIKDQTAAAQNGIYQLSVVGDSISTPWILTRSVDFNSPTTIVNGGLVFVEMGNTNADTLWQDNFVGTLVVGTTAINWDLSSLIPGEIVWQVVTVPAVDALPQNGYITDRATQVQVLLPATFAIGDVVEVRGLGTGGWAVLPNAGQTIQFGSSTASNSIQSDIQYANITLRGIVANTTWTVDLTNSNNQVS